VLQEARCYYPSRYVGRWPEQSAVNLVIRHSKTVGLLDNRYNFIVRKHQHRVAVSGRYGATNLHFVGLRGSEGVKEIQQAMGVS